MVSFRCLENWRIVTGFLLLVLLAGCGLKQNASSADVVAKTFLRRMQAGNFKGAQQLLTLAVGKANSVRQLKYFWGVALKRQGQLKSWSSRAVKVNQNTAVITYTLQWSKGQTSAQFRVQHISGSTWLIDKFVL